MAVTGKALLKEVILRPPYDGAKNYFYISDVDEFYDQFKIIFKDGLTGTL